MDSMFTLTEARKYLLGLPELLQDHLDEDYRRGLTQLLDRFEELFNIIAGINLRADEGRVIDTGEATEISDYGFVLLLKLVDLMERLDLPHRRREIEQISLVFARWTISYGGTINTLEPLVNAIAQLSNLLHDKQALIELCALIDDIVAHCSAELMRDDDEDAVRAWRLLHVNRGIVATRSHDLDAMKRAFDDFLRFLPGDAQGFFAEGMKEMDALNYPDHVREIMEFYSQQNPSVRLH